MPLSDYIPSGTTAAVAAGGVAVVAVVYISSRSRDNDSSSSVARDQVAKALGNSEQAALLLPRSFLSSPPPAAANVEAQTAGNSGWLAGPVGSMVTTAAESASEGFLSYLTPALDIVAGGGAAEEAIRGADRAAQALARAQKLLSAKSKRLAAARANPSPSPYYKSMAEEMGRPPPVAPKPEPPQNEEEEAVFAAEEEARKKAPRTRVPSRAPALAAGKVWKDPDFAGGDAALSLVPNAPILQKLGGAVDWVPPAMVCATAKAPGLRADGGGGGTWLWDAPRDGGLKAGARSGGWAAGEHFVATAAVLVVRHDPTLADDLIDAEFEGRGVYGVALYRTGALTMVWIDALFPATGGQKRSTMLFGTGEKNPSDVWPSAVEKAIAKTAGSYAAIEGSGGGMGAALQILLGTQAETWTIPAASPAAANEAFRKLDAALSRQGGVGRGGGRGGPLLLLCSRPDLPSSTHCLVPPGQSFAVLDTDAANKLVLVAGAHARVEGKPVGGARDPPQGDPTAFWLRASEVPALFESLHVVTRRISAEDVKRGEALRARFAGEPSALKPGLALRDEHRAAEDGARAAAANLLQEEEAAAKRRAKGSKGKSAGRKGA